MVSKKFVVITACDKKYGDFLIEHWLVSLKKNIDLRLVQIVVLDYGLTGEQSEMLKSRGVIVKKCKRDGSVVNIRFRDMLSFLKNKKYKQVLTCDGGDIIFQKNIMHLFYENNNKFRAVVEDMPPATIEISVFERTIKKDIQHELLRMVKGKKTINGGLIVADYSHFIDLCAKMNKYIINKNLFGPDQAILNYVLYKEGFVNLGSDYNYIPCTVQDSPAVKKGVFFNGQGKIISVVHNAGAVKFMRVVKNFGYGGEHNQINYLKMGLLRVWFHLGFVMKGLFRFVIHFY